MLVRLSPHPDQLRWYLQSALNGFDTLDFPQAVEHAKADIAAFLAYLDRTDNAVLVTGIKPVEPGVWYEFDLGKGDVSDFL